MRRKSRSCPKKTLLPAVARSPTDVSKEEIATKLIRGIWDSLESHLDYCVENSSEGKPFHRRCVKDYAEQIRLASKLL